LNEKMPPGKPILAIFPVPGGLEGRQGLVANQAGEWQNPLEARGI
jgi:hypothetical protein